MVFPEKNLQNQYIRETYQNVLQKHVSGSSLFVLDGTGVELFHIPSASVGFEFGNSTGLQTGSNYPITASQSDNSSLLAGTGSTTFATTGSNIFIGNQTVQGTASISYITTSRIDIGNGSITANLAGTASYAISASYAPSTGTSLTTGSLYPITSSHALTASYILGGGGGSSESASFAQTSSYSVSASYLIGYAGLIIPQYNQSVLSYSASYNQLSSVTYKWSGSTVAIIELDYSGSLFIGARRTF